MTENLQEQINALRSEIESLKKAPAFPPSLDPQSSQTIEQTIALPYLTAAPTFTPKFNGKEVVYKSGSDYYYAVYADSGWRSQKLGITAPATFTSTNTSIAVPNGTLVDTAGTWATGLTTCDLIIGNFRLGGTNNQIGIWKSGLESATAIVSDGKGNSDQSFLGVDSSIYFHGLSFSAGTLTYHYKNTSVSSWTADLWAIGTV